MYQEIDHFWLLLGISTRDYIALAKENKIRRLEKNIELNYKVEGYVRNGIIMY